MKEKRRFPRIDDNCMVEVFEFKSSEISKESEKSPKILSHNRDISLGGISFLNDVEIEKGKFVKVVLSHILIPKDLTFPGKVVRVLPKGEQFLIAVQFLDMNEKQIKHLKQYIDSKLP